MSKNEFVNWANAQALKNVPLELTRETLQKAKAWLIQDLNLRGSQDDWTVPVILIEDNGAKTQIGRWRV